MSTEIGLRERKKRQTRQAISDIASGLFMLRGFDNVTVAEVARAANVSTKTVFNYFPRKEDLFLDRIPEAIELINQAVHGRPPGEEPPAALRRLFLDLLRRGHPLAGIGEGYQHFWQVILDSPALLARLRECVEEVEDQLACLLAEAAGTGPGDPRAQMTAALIVTVYRTTFVISARRVLAGEPAAAVIPDHIALLEHAFAALEGTLAAL